jgi:hypothetical protein
MDKIEHSAKFVKWLHELNEKDCTRYGIQYIKLFYALPLAMRWGVYLEYFDSVGIYIYIGQSFGYEWRITKDNLKTFDHELDFDTRPEAQTAAIIKAFSLDK